MLHILGCLDVCIGPAAMLGSFLQELSFGGFKKATDRRDFWLFQAIAAAATLFAGYVCLIG